MGGCAVSDLGLLQIATDEGEQIGRCFVAGGKAAIEGFQVSPADGFLDVLGAATFLQQAAQGLAIQGIARLQFTDGQLGLGHGVTQRNSNLCNRLPLGRPLAAGPRQLFGPSPARWSTSWLLWSRASCSISWIGPCSQRAT
jgi:hypothetical protein